MTPLATWLLSFLPHGRDAAISVKQLVVEAAKVHGPLNERRLREAKDELWNEGHMVGSCVHGFYLIATVEEAAEAVRYYREPALDLMAKAAARWRVAREKFGSAWAESPLAQASQEGT